MGIAAFNKHPLLRVNLKLSNNFCIAIWFIFLSVVLSKQNRSTYSVERISLAKPSLISSSAENREFCSHQVAFGCVYFR